MNKKTMRAAHNLELTAWERKYGELKDADNRRIDTRDRTISALHVVKDELEKDVGFYSTFASEVEEARERLARRLQGWSEETDATHLSSTGHDAVDGAWSCRVETESAFKHPMHDENPQSPTYCGVEATEEVRPNDADFAIVGRMDEFLAASKEPLSRVDFARWLNDNFTLYPR